MVLLMNNMIVQFYDAPETLVDILTYLNWVMTMLFLVETLLKLYAFGKVNYFSIIYFLCGCVCVFSVFLTACPAN